VRVIVCYTLSILIILDVLGYAPVFRKSDVVAIKTQT
jgi:hypothetical protein